MSLQLELNRSKEKINYFANLNMELKMTSMKQEEKV